MADEEEDYRKQGWVVKKGAIIKNWKRRWFILYDDRIEYYTDETKKVHRGTIGLSNGGTLENADDRKDMPFLLLLTPYQSRDGRIWELSLEDEDDRDSWRNAISHVLTIKRRETEATELALHSLSSREGKHFNRPGFNNLKSPRSNPVEYNPDDYELSDDEDEEASDVGDVNGQVNDNDQVAEEAKNTGANVDAPITNDEVEVAEAAVSPTGEENESDNVGQSVPEYDDHKEGAAPAEDSEVATDGSASSTITNVDAAPAENVE